MPLSPEEVINSEHVRNLVLYFQEAIDKELAKGVHKRISIQYYPRSISELTEHFRELLRANYIAAGWKDLKFIDFSHGYAHITLVK